MSQEKEINKVIQALVKVPAKSLRLVKLANELAGADGQLNNELAARRQDEVNLAVAEAKVYGASTEIAVRSLATLKAVKEVD